MQTVRNKENWSIRVDKDENLKNWSLKLELSN